MFDSFILFYLYLTRTEFYCLHFFHLFVFPISKKCNKDACMQLNLIMFGIFDTFPPPPTATASMFSRNLVTFAIIHFLSQQRVDGIQSSFVKIKISCISSILQGDLSNNIFFTNCLLNPKCCIFVSIWV